MKKFLRRIITQRVINNLYHLPEGIAASVVYGFPARSIKVIGVTGTDGKTTTVNMVYQLLKDSGKKTSMVSTINAVIGDERYDTGFHITSPGRFTIQNLLRKAVRSGSEYLVLEATSHALDQYRYWGIKCQIGVITNITHEHLDYHKTFENYVKTKAKLIRGTTWSILNYDDPSFSKLSQMTKGEVVSFGQSKEADLNPSNFPLKLKVPGEYNVLNALAAAAVGLILDIDKGRIKKSLEEFQGLTGRMEEIKNSRGIRVIVDFAHTPNGLENALKTLRPLTKGKLISVFGEPSERDLGKRPLMGEISSRLADITVLTDEDPRFEDRMKIINETAAGGVFMEGKNLFKEPDRLKAIKLAIGLAKRGDTVGIFGKGHEQSMNYRGVEKPWSDIEAAKKVLS